MKAHLCAGCLRELRDGWLCTDCLATLQDKLVDVRWLVEELDVMLCRLARTGPDAPRGRSRETPLAFNWAAAETSWTMQRALGRWAGRLATANGAQVVFVHGYHLTDPKDPARVFPRRSVTEGLARWLLEHLRWVPVHPDAGPLYAEVVDAIADANHVIDHPGQRSFVGRCHQCAGELYARAGAKLVSCTVCHHEHDIEQRRTEQLNAAQDFPVTATEASRALPHLLGVEVTASMIRGYHLRGRLEPLPPRTGGLGARGPHYRLGDVVAAHSAAQEAKHRSKAAPLGMMANEGHGSDLGGKREDPSACQLGSGTGGSLGSGAQAPDVGSGEAAPAVRLPPGEARPTTYVARSRARSPSAPRPATIGRSGILG